MCLSDKNSLNGTATGKLEDKRRTAYESRAKALVGLNSLTESSELYPVKRAAADFIVEVFKASDERYPSDLTDRMFEKSVEDVMSASMLAVKAITFHE